MELIAKKTDHYGEWYRQWSLIDDAGKRYGSMIQNTTWSADQQYVIYISNHIHSEMGMHVHKHFSDRAEALEWARTQIESLPTPTREEIDHMIQKAKNARYQDEMSDDYAFSNGKSQRWTRIIQEMEAMKVTVA